MSINTGLYKRIGQAAAAIFIGATVTFATPHLERLEGVELKPYADQLAGGLITYCSGSTDKSRLKASYTPEECQTITKEDATKFAVIVAANVNVPISVQTGSAFLLFSYNVGPTAFKSSTALRLVNAGQFEAGCRALATQDWSNGSCRGYGCGWASGKMVKGLQNRRIFERDMCLKGLQDAKENDPR